MAARIYQSIEILLVLTVLMIIGTGCTPSQALPTLMILPTQQPSQTPTSTAIEIAQVSTPTPSSSPTATRTPSITPTHTPSATITSTPTPSRTPTPTLTLTLTPTATPESDAIVANDEGVNLRKGPHVSFEPPIVLIKKDTRLALVAISPNLLWYKVETEDGTQGWAYSKLLTIYRDVAGLPVVDVPLPTSVPVISVVQPPLIPPVGGGVTGPVVLGSGGGGVSVPGLVSARVMQIYQQGRTMGNNPRVFAKVGDSITNNQTFMSGYVNGQYNLGGYTSLQDSIGYFSGDSFRRDSMAAESAFNAAAVMDPIWAPQGICQPNESPLMCEYRVTRPSVAIILLGAVDVQLYDVNAYNTYMNQVVNATISQGIVPVLTTFAYAGDYYPGQSEAFNNVIRSIAASQQLPLIDLQAATVNMPNRGVVEDKFHLTSRGDEWIDLNGEQNQYGTTMRSFMTLQVLDNLRRGLGMN